MTLKIERLVIDEGSDRTTAFDLPDVRLVDCEAVMFLARFEEAGARLDNCPAYIREWILEGKKDS